MLFCPFSKFCAAAFSFQWTFYIKAFLSMKPGHKRYLKDTQKYYVITRNIIVVRKEEEGI